MEIPTGWAVAPLSDLVTSDGIFTDGDWVESKDQDPDGHVRLTQLADVGDGFFRDRSKRSMTHEKANELRCTFLQEGDILVARMPDPLGRACLYPGSKRPAVTVVDVCVIRAGRNGVDNRWLMWAINAPQVRQQIHSYQTGTTRKRISRKNLEKVKLAIPPLAEQCRIVEALEDHLSRLEAAQADLRKSIARLPALRGGVRNIVTRAHKADVPLPDGWSWGTLDDVLARIEAGKSFRCEPRPAAEDEWGVIKVSAMTWGEFRAEEQKAVPAGRDFDPRHEIEPGDILVSRANTPAYVGAPVLVGKCRPRLLLSDKSLRLVPNPGVNRKWLIQALSTPSVRNQISVKATGTKDSMRNISQRELSGIRIPIPPPEDQAVIGETLETEVQRVDKLETGLIIAQARAGHLRRALLGRAFSGKLVPQDPADEPASVLLERIRTEVEGQGGKPKQGVRRPRKAVTVGAPPPPLASSTPPPANAVQQELPL
ncbi:restriction endonuclease subunit S [Streptomyces sp. NPDC006668]|uniref:restriction endonuclease subunit S n=1 Tax=Streptomyces sp. NPDC006668 TaxID=3156903 RepID=UPI00340D59FD